jgi:hypothetical protein
MLKNAGPLERSDYGRSALGFQTVKSIPGGWLDRDRDLIDLS